MKEISTPVDDSLEEILKIAYQNELRYVTVPKLISLYETFCGEWFLHMYCFLEINADAFELSETDMENLENIMQDLGFQCPTLEAFKALIDERKLFYEWEQKFFNKAVLGIW